MKALRKIFLLVFAVYISISACDDELLELQDQNRLNPDVFWQNEEHATRAIIGAYSPMANQFGWGRMRVQHTTFRGDAVNPPRGEAGNFSADPALATLEWSWGEYWKVIFRTNAILEKVPLIEDPAFSDASRNAIVGEAYYLRAMQYFYLLSQYRNIPLVTVAAGSLAEVRQGPADPEDIWQLMISDLKAAQPLLPQSWDEENLGRATWGSATGLLGKVYLYHSGIEGVNEYSLAAAEFKKIIDSGIYQLMTNHADNFCNGCDNNAESVFEIQLDNTAAGWNTDTEADLRTAAWEADLAPVGFSNQGGLEVNRFVLDAFLAETTNGGGEDPRARSTLLFDYPGAMVYESAFQEVYADNLSLIGVRKSLDMRPGKPAASFGFDGLGSPINWKIMRFADVLLMYAEAENEANGGSNLALEALNMVRNRSDMPPKATADQATLRQFIRDERLLELVFEGDRYMDLLRWGMVPSAFTDELKSRSGGLQYQPGREYLPIPQIEINTNPFYEQNQGYR
ncbi:RagB/SusD family nutrient uptake outer membrane protein [Fulvivirgaceae bacterium BMA12]|uniref:RagB/SusD family nutrient uptake outer membrane protein n=1 Tax=Agaribacillus aureus TaxID=3051825 RepID=A0ABT8KZG7_9BACT|nr:RagB/SusD family nutrient uptake outer membrane protein [Fulvivirgaceae bacterium BMA12]